MNAHQGTAPPNCSAARCALRHAASPNVVASEAAPATANSTSAPVSRPPLGNCRSTGAKPVGNVRPAGTPASWAPTFSVLTSAGGSFSSLSSSLCSRRRVESAMGTEHNIRFVQCHQRLLFSMTNNVQTRALLTLRTALGNQRAANARKSAAGNSPRALPRFHLLFVGNGLERLPVERTHALRAVKPYPLRS